MTDIQKETVIIVHGTWAAPQADTPNWYLPSRDGSSPNFISRLNLELEKQGSAARCWAHCKDNDSIFHWTGKNDWIDRSLGATQLAETINNLHSEGWRVHIVAHSHGGNVALEALPALKPTATSPLGITGTVTTLGTPFIDVMSSIAERIDRRQTIEAIIAWLTYIMLLLRLLLRSASLYIVTSKYHFLNSSKSIFSLVRLLSVSFQSALSHGRVAEEEMDGNDIGRNWARRISIARSC
jgi:hypothetical protein